MSKVRIAVALAKDVFELAVATAGGHGHERKRLTRAQFERFWSMRPPCKVVIEACGSAHHWARHLIALGFEVTLLPARYVRPYRQRNETDRVDCAALLEAFRSPRIKPVAVRNRDQQAILAFHRKDDHAKRHGMVTSSAWSELSFSGRRPRHPSRCAPTVGRRSAAMRL